MYAELAVTTNFSFLHSASHVDELVETAATLGLSAISITDHNTLASVVRGHQAAKKAGIKLIVGARLNLQDAPSLLCFPRNRSSYAQLSKLITLGRRRAPKGECKIFLKDVLDHSKEQVLISLPPPEFNNRYMEHLHYLQKRLANNVWLAARCHYDGNDATHLYNLAQLSVKTNVPMVATNDVLMHTPDRKPLMDIVTCIREHCTIDQAGFRLAMNAERHLKPPKEMARLFQLYPEAIARTVEITNLCEFSIDELRYEYPVDEAPPGTTPQEELVRLTWEGAKIRYPNDLPCKVRKQLEYELKLINKLKYAPYFLTVHDIVRHARSRGILCQGRGSAANSAVCYCLGITAIDPTRIDLLFERFVSVERNEPPDIDVDFEHERREEIIQYIYKKYGRERAGLAATVVHYRARMAVREVGKAMGLKDDTVSVLASTVWGWRSDKINKEHIRDTGLDPDDLRLSLTIRLARELIGFPRHLSQHVGGFVITKGPLSELVPVANAAMEKRTTIEWDKDDLDALGILKIDVLGLGMLSCIRKSFELLEQHYKKKVDLSSVPAEDPSVYNMLCEADSVGVFQVESRAQMTMLPRLKPKNFYDLVIEVAIVRPGPIQGNMVHPYLRRRNGEEKIDYPSQELKSVLGKTFGVPLFQEQAMKIAIVAGGFTPSEADQLRRAMATFRHVGTIHTFEKKLTNGMISNGYAPDFARRCFDQIKGFGEYGFPESHAASFALLVYVSSWLKKHYPDIFTTALLNSQPMGFYAPAQLIRDAKEHGVKIRPVDVNYSSWDATLELNGTGHRAIRLGFRQIKDLSKNEADTLVKSRSHPFTNLTDLYLRTHLKTTTLAHLAKADAFKSMNLSRRQAMWAIRSTPTTLLPLFKDGENRNGNDVSLPLMKIGEEVTYDYATLRLSLKSHPLALLREKLNTTRVVPAGHLLQINDGARVIVAGLTLVRQRPGTASGVIFITLEDETGVANLVIWPKIFVRFRQVVMRGRLIRATGTLQREGIVTHIIVNQIEDLTFLLQALGKPDLRSIKQQRVTGENYKKTTICTDGNQSTTPNIKTQNIFQSRDFH